MEQQVRGREIGHLHGRELALQVRLQGRAYLRETRDERQELGDEKNPVDPLLLQLPDHLRVALPLAPGASGSRPAAGAGRGRHPDRRAGGLRR